MDDKKISVDKKIAVLIDADNTSSNLQKHYFKKLLNMELHLYVEYMETGQEIHRVGKINYWILH